MVKKRESTSLNVDPEIWKKAKIHAVTNGMTLTELVEKAVDDWVTKHRNRKHDHD